jgi:hypothetical protein
VEEHIAVVRKIMKFIIGEGGNSKSGWSLSGPVEKQEGKKKSRLFVSRCFYISSWGKSGWFLG